MNGTRRLSLTRPATERLLALGGVRTPWRAAAPTRTVSRLGAGSAPEDPDAELARLGALHVDGLHRDLAPVLDVLRQPHLLVDVDLAVPRPGGDVRYHSWQRLAGDRVVALSTAGRELELSWHPRTEWGGALARVPAAADPAVEPSGSTGSGCRARLRVVVTGPVRVHWVGWVLLADGWRELGPDGAGVRLTPTAPTRLGERVERLVDGVLP